MKRLLCRIGWHEVEIRRDHIPTFDVAGGVDEVLSIHCPRCGHSDVLMRIPMPTRIGSSSPKEKP